MWVVVATAKVRIFKQITTVSKKGRIGQCCCCYRKGTNFQANHNLSYGVDPRFLVVVATAKVRIFKQITTLLTVILMTCSLLLLPQRYEFSSKSQQRRGGRRDSGVVVATAKVRIFKQITTNFTFNIQIFTLLLLPQRYEFSSKSQRAVQACCRKRVVVATAKVRIFKQITTVHGRKEAINSCCCYRKGTNFQANHNWF